MVVDPNTVVNTMITAPPAACPTAVTAMLPPAAITAAYIQGLSPINQVSSVQYAQECFPPVLSGQILTAVPVSSILPGSQTMNNCASEASPVDNYALSIYPSNGFFSQNIVPYAYVPVKNDMPPQILSNVPSTFIPCDPKLVSNSQTTSSSNLVQCNPGPIYTYTTIPTPPLVPCASRMITGAPVLPMHLTSVLPTGSLEMRPINNPQMFNSIDVFRASPPPALPPVASTWKQSYGMEIVWQNQFKRLFEQYERHLWVLLPITEKPQGHWNTYVDSAKVRFCCEDCGHGWTSMKGRVAFWFVLNTNGEGMVCLKLYGQQCDRCPTRNYEPAMWYPEEVQKVMINIYNKVGELYYGFKLPPFFNNRRAGKPRTPHNNELCQACKDGVCSERR